MTPRGQVFLMRLGSDESVLEKLGLLVEADLRPRELLARPEGVYLSLDSPTSTQRIADVIGRSIPVSTCDSIPAETSPPGSDWFVRFLGQEYKIRECLSSVVDRLQRFSSEHDGSQLMRMKNSGVNPAMLDLRLSAVEMTGSVESKRLLFKEAERHDLAVVFQRLEMFKKRKGLVCFDLDSTLVAEELIVETASKVGKAAEVEELTDKAMSGELDYSRSFLHRVGLLAGVTATDLEEVWREATPADGVLELLQDLRMKGIKTAILSGAFSFFVERARDRFGVDFAFGNEVEIRDGRMTGSVKGEIVDGSVKGKKMRELAGSLGLTVDQVVAVGDGANDLEIIRKTGTGIAYDKGGAVKTEADGLLPEGRLRQLPLLTGM
jgi:phosphoserine phosphatase SerB